MVAQTTPLVALVSNFGGRLPAGMLLGRRRLRRLWRPLASSWAEGSLLGCCWLMALQTTPLVALVTKLGKGLPVTMV